MSEDSNNDRRGFRVGLTGGIASGKSTVADILGELGADVIDTDVIAREVVMPGQPALDEIRERFGKAVLNPNGELDRRALRQLVFSDDRQRAALEGILHPRIQREALRQADAASGPYQLIVVPLLTQSPLAAALDRILVVDCDEDTQIARLIARDAESEKQARRILAAQATRAERLAIADDVVSNDGSLAELRESTVAVHRQYLELASLKNE
ncbi:MAG: dephospho-CoA kinase [Pseudomonadota bacterium]